MAEVVAFSFLRAKTTYASATELLPQLLGVLVGYLMTVLHIGDYLLCLLFAVASAEEVNNVGVVVGQATFSTPSFLASSFPEVN